MENPRNARDEAIDYWKTWYQGENSSLAMFRYSKNDNSEHTGYFSDLGTTTIIGVEIDNGPRDGHVYWRRSKGWSVLMRFPSIQWVFSHIQMYPDPSGIRDAILYGECLFDKTGISDTFKKVAKDTHQSRLISSRELFHHKIQLDELIEKLNEILSRGNQSIDLLFDIYLDITTISHRITGTHSLTQNITPYMSCSKNSKTTFMASVKALIELSYDLLARIGGKPPSEWYSPASFIHLIPPREDGKKRTHDLEPDISACANCDRTFIENPLPTPGIPGSSIISNDSTHSEESS